MTVCPPSFYVAVTSATVLALLFVILVVILSSAALMMEFICLYEIFLSTNALSTNSFLPAGFLQPWRVRLQKPATLS
jgi:hypothetical protein